ncbi:DUF3179 domain-containing protein [Hyunsoonleella flava]|uniref:DUF3179 domain-containing protein n=1 Tax=Hyunsoonleella flava TaxID=2527939 RepID=A0A4V2JA40_9FLAO|nr:DUF3179 domain-containing protein [Hyunsoonleella flava]TBN03903.1 DUF3179 domain-containing protein [Hyunsoonleella flava]
MKTYIIYILMLLAFTACSTGDSDNGVLPQGVNNPLNPSDEGPDENTRVDGSWLIPKDQVKDGGPGKDGIPSIDFPKFISADEATFLSDNDLIVGIIDDGIPKAYPHEILDWHEVVNDNDIAINYCPLTGTAFAWEAKDVDFGVSGLLYNSNLIMYDRNTQSNWSQLKLQCVNGSAIGNRPTLLKVIETDWKTWSRIYPKTEVLSLNTGFPRDYTTYPYGDYKTNHDRLIFSVSPTNDALPSKQRVFALINRGSSKAYKFSDFTDGKAFKDNFSFADYVIVGNSSLIYAFKLSENLKHLNFEYSHSNGEEFFKDDEGNAWNIFGEAIEGPRKGQVLGTANSVVSFWFAVAAFYPNIQLYSNK